MKLMSAEVRLRRTPLGEPSLGDLELVRVAVSQPAHGEVLVRNTWMSLDPAMRVRMGGSGGSIGEVPAFVVGRPLDGMAVGEVVATGSPDFAIGDHVVHALGWREFSLLDPQAPAHRVEMIQPDDVAPPSSYLGLMSLVGFTAYVGLHHVARVQPGEIVWVSAAAGAVGSLAVQLAKLHGNLVVASAGSDRKIRHLREDLGVDHAFNYRDGDLSDRMSLCAPSGIDVYFDNVGGDHLRVALDALRPRGRVALCGMVSSYNTPQSHSGPANLFQAIGKNLTLQGFLAVHYRQHLEEYRERMRSWLTQGLIDYREEISVGLESAPQAFLDLMRGDHIGKVLVDLR